MLILIDSIINIIRIDGNTCAELIHKNKHMENFFLFFVFKSQFVNLHDSNIEYIKEINWKSFESLNNKNHLSHFNETDIDTIVIYFSSQAEFSLRVEFPAKKKKKKRKEKRKTKKRKGEKKSWASRFEFSQTFSIPKAKGLARCGSWPKVSSSRARRLQVERTSR